MQQTAFHAYYTARKPENLHDSYGISSSFSGGAMPTMMIAALKLTK